jgi:hypothetical protein
MSDKNNVHFRAEVNIEEGKIEEYKQLVQEMIKEVKANEPARYDKLPALSR